MNSISARQSFSRREACLSLAALVAGALCPSRGDSAESKSSQISFGFSHYGMKSLSIANSLMVCKQIGYDAIELCCMKDWVTAPEKLEPAARKAIREDLIRRQMTLPALMDNLPLLVDQTQRDEHLERIKRAGELGHELSPKSPPVLETIMGGKPDDWPKVQNEMVDELGRWAEAAASVKTVMAVKPHVSGAVHAPEAADWLIRQVDSPWIRLAYDFSHYHVRGFDLQESLKLLLPHTVFIHVKDNVGKDGKVKFDLPGAGDTDYAGYFKTVQNSGYQGTVMVEVSSQLWRQESYDAQNAARHSFENLAPKLIETGLWCGGC